jgi:hypothetical protein
MREGCPEKEIFKWDVDGEKQEQGKGKGILCATEALMLIKPHASGIVFNSQGFLFKSLETFF